MKSSAARMKRKTGTAAAVAHRAMWLLKRPTVRLRKVTILGPRTYLRLASSWANIQTSIPSTCPMIAPATPRQPNTIPRTVGGIHVERETTRSSPGARQSHAAIRVPAAPSRGMSWRRPAKPVMPTRVEAAMSSMGPSDVKQRRQGTIGCVSRPETAGAWTRPRYIRPMILGMSIATYTLLHTVLSLVGIVAGLVVAGGLVTRARLDRWAAPFFLTTAPADTSGFRVSFTKPISSHLVGGLAPGGLGVGVVAG